MSLFGPPSFGLEPDHLGMPSAPPMLGAPPAMPMPQAPPSMMPPSFGPSPMPPQVGPQPMGKGRELLMLLPALLGGIKDPSLLGAALRGLQKGKDSRRAAMEDAQTRADREARERAEFHSRMLEHAAQFDDEIALNDFLRVVGPTAEYYGIPTAGITISDQKKANKDRKQVQDAMETLVDLYGPEILNQEGYKVVLPDGRRFDMATAKAMTGTVEDAGGKSVPVPGKVASPFVASTPDEMKIAAHARALGKKPEEMTPEEIQAAVSVGKPVSTSSTPNVGSFEDYVVRLYGENPTPSQITQARKDYNQSDDRAPTANTGAQDQRRFAMEQRLVAQWDKANTPMREMRRQHGLMEAGLKRFRSGDKNGGSQAVLVTFQKVLDPTSVVRESEYARTTEGQSLMNRIEGYATRLAQGGATLTDSELAEMVLTAKSFLDGMATHTAGLRQRIERTAGEYELDPRLIFDDVGAPADASPAAPARSKIKSVTRVK